MKIKKSFLSSLLLLILVAFLLGALGVAFQKSQARSEEKAQREQKAKDIQEISLHQESFQKLTSYFTDLAKRKGAAYAYDILRNAPLPPNTDIHLLAHAIGDILYQQQGVNGITLCTDEFRNACSHSIVVALFQKYGSKAAKEIADTCKKAPGGKGAYSMCFHGLGHGVLAYTKYDMQKAVPLCEVMGTTEYNNQETIECVGGITMEMIAGVHDPKQWQEQKTTYLPADDPLAPCNMSFMTDLVKPQCYNYLTPHLITSAGGNIDAFDEITYQKAFSYCDQIPQSDTLSRQQCFGGFGKEFIVLVKNRDIRNLENLTQQELQTVASWCALGKSADGITSCVISAVNSLLWGTENDPTSAITFCDVQQDGIAEICTNHLINAVAFYNPQRDYKKKFCEGLSKAYKSQCEEKLALKA